MIHLILNGTSCRVNECDIFLRRLHLTRLTQFCAIQIIVKIRGLVLDGRPMAIFSYNHKGIKLMRKGRSIRSILNVERNNIPDDRSHMANSIACKTILQKNGRGDFEVNKEEAHLM